MARQDMFVKVLGVGREQITLRFDNATGSYSANPNSDSGESVGDELAHVANLRTIKHIISGNNFAMPSQLKKLKDCVSRIAKLYSTTKGIHPAFKK
ncbi:hypothetical protein R6Q59_004952 [Mikania micrantha]